MRNGNVINSMWYEGSIYCSYPTYEEWKLRSNSPNRPRGSSGSYPTYEEWKQEALKLLEKNEFVFLSYLWGNGNKEIVVRNNLRNKNSSYLTYEEWKPTRKL